MKLRKKKIFFSDEKPSKTGTDRKIKTGIYY